MNKKIEYFPYYRETFDALLIPEGFMRKNNTYYRILKNTNCIQIFERGRRRSETLVDYDLFVVHTSFNEIIKKVNSDTYAIGIQLDQLFEMKNGFSLYDFKKLASENKSKEESMDDRQNMVYQHIDCMANYMKTKGLEFFNQHSDIYTIRNILLDIYGEYQIGRADTWLYLGDFERIKVILEQDVILQEEQIKRSHEIKKDTIKNKQQKTEKELIVALNFYDQFIQYAEEMIVNDLLMLKMIKEKNKSWLREQLKLNDQTTRNSVAAFLKQDMIPLDLDEWEHRVF